MLEYYSMIKIFVSKHNNERTQVAKIFYKLFTKFLLYSTQKCIQPLNYFLSVNIKYSRHLLYEDNKKYFLRFL